jgi:hypothetical protein
VRPCGSARFAGQRLSAAKEAFFAVLNFATFFQEKVVGHCGLEQIDDNNAEPYNYEIATSPHFTFPSAAPRNDNLFNVIPPSKSRRDSKTRNGGVLIIPT